MSPSERLSAQPRMVPHGVVRSDLAPHGAGPTNLADLLERVLDKGIVIAGDIQINLLDIELLTIKLRLLVASVDRAKEMGINWWESDPTLTSGAGQLERENDELRARLDRLERAIAPATQRAIGASAGQRARSSEEPSRMRASSAPKSRSPAAKSRSPAAKRPTSTAKRQRSTAKRSTSAAKRPTATAKRASSTPNRQSSTARQPPPRAGGAQ